VSVRPRVRCHSGVSATSVKDSVDAYVLNADSGRYADALISYSHRGSTGNET